LPFAVVYLDDILIFSRTPENHVRHVEEILNRLNHFFLKMKKCEFFEFEILFFKANLSTRQIHNKKNRFNPRRGGFSKKKKNGYLNWIGPCVRHHPLIQHGYVEGEFKRGESPWFKVIVNIQTVAKA
jgi:hypothetical protein